MRQDLTRRFEAARDLAEIEPAELVRRVLSSLRRYFWLLAACLALGVGLGAAFAARQDPFYAARASIIIDPRIDEGMAGVQAPTVLLADALVVDSEVEVLRSEQVLTRVVDRLGLVEEARAGAPVEADEPESQLADDAELERALIAGIAERLAISREGTTFVVRIAATAADPARAAAIANAVAEAYLETRRAERALQARQAQEFLRAQIDAMSAEVMAAEMRAERFLFENDIPDDRARSAVEQELADNETALIAARNAIRTARAEIASIEHALGTDGEAARNAQAQLVAALDGQAGLRLTQVGDELARLRDIRIARIGIHEAETAALTAAGDALKAASAAISERQVELRELRRIAAATKAQYETLLARFKEVQSEAGFFRSSARVIERATPPAAPANPAAKLVIGAAGAGGLLLGLGLVFVREQTDDSLRSSDDVAARLGLPFLGHLPRLSRRDLATEEPTLADASRRWHRRDRRELARLSHVAAAPFSFVAETFRRTMIEVRAHHADRRPLVIAAVSAVSNEGKSFFAANLTFFLAGQGQNVLLVDADLRNPHLGRQLVPLAESRINPGGTSPVDGGSSLILADVADGVTLLTLSDSGRPADGERDLHILGHIVRDASEEIDVVVIDTPPLGYVSDGLRLAGLIDAAILVVRWGSTRSGALKRVLAANRAVADRIAGVCLSQTSVASLRRHEYLPVNTAYYRPASTSQPQRKR